MKNGLFNIYAIVMIIVTITFAAITINLGNISSVDTKLNIICILIMAIILLSDYIIGLKKAKKVGLSFKKASEDLIYSK